MQGALTSDGAALFEKNTVDSIRTRCIEGFPGMKGCLASK